VASAARNVRSASALRLVFRTLSYQSGIPNWRDIGRRPDSRPCLMIRSGRSGKKKGKRPVCPRPPVSPGCPVPPSAHASEAFARIIRVARTAASLANSNPERMMKSICATSFGLTQINFFISSAVNPSPQPDYLFSRRLTNGNSGITNAQIHSSPARRKPIPCPDSSQQQSNLGRAGRVYASCPFPASN
jgi:hypothetical protein